MWRWEAEQAKGVIVIVHGAFEHHGRYGWLTEMFRLNGFHVVMGDLPGQGVTSRSRQGHIDKFDEYIIEVKDWIQEAYKFELPVFLLGHSMGGLVSIRLLQEEHMNLAGVVLSSPCLGLVHTPSKLLNILSHGFNIVFPKLRINAGITVEMATRNEEVWDVDKNDSLYVTKVSVRWYRELVKGIELAFTNLSKFPDVPLLVMQSGDDKIVNKIAVQHWFNEVALTEKTYKEWPSCYHEIFNEPEREQVFNFTMNFLQNRLQQVQAK
jgi:lysophospholipase